jgi:hypothetical protein
VTEPPGTGSLVEQITVLKKRIDELTRKAPVVPVCQVRLAINASLAAGDSLAQGGWAASEDDFGMFTLGAPSYITIKLDGYYSLIYHCGITSTPTGTIVAVKIQVNSLSVFQAAASDLALMPSGGEGAILDGFRARIHLNAGDKVYWSNYTSSAASLPGVLNGVPAEITVQYLGSH